jgi:hypothetical protein
MRSARRNRNQILSISPYFFSWAPGQHCAARSALRDSPVAGPTSTPSSTSPSWRQLSSSGSSHYRVKLIHSRLQTRTLTNLTRTRKTMAQKSSSTNGRTPPADPVERTSSPYPDPRQLGPKSQILASRTSNFHSTSLRMVTASASVNKTCECSGLYFCLQLLTVLLPHSPPPRWCSTGTRTHRTRERASREGTYRL